VTDYAPVDKFNDNSTSPGEDNTPHPLDGLAGAERDAAESTLVATDQFRSVMSQVPSAVSVVTCALDGQPYGATVSAFASLSMEPPMMLVALNRHSGLLHIILQASRFRINVLSADQQEIAAWFASNRSPDRFIGPRWRYDDGLPLIFDAQAWITCALGEVLHGGDHVILLGYVKDAAAQPRPPLVRYARTFGTYSPWDRGQVYDNTGLPRPRRPAEQDVTDGRELLRCTDRRGHRSASYLSTAHCW
jgi:flavin reductase (DIM6/NTAB) family NADH-FMN oxidoreductase RutF